MAVIMSLVSVLLIVLAITCNQGAARSVDRRSIDSNDLSCSKESSTEADGDRTYIIPKLKRKDYAITIKGTINTNDPMFLVEVPSVSGQNKRCHIKYDFQKQIIQVSPAVEKYETSKYSLKLKPGCKGPSFTLTVATRKIRNDMDTLGMIFDTAEGGQTKQLLCYTDFGDINKIEIKKGVARVDSILFENNRVSKSAED